MAKISHFRNFFRKWLIFAYCWSSNIFLCFEVKKLKNNVSIESEQCKMIHLNLVLVQINIILI